MGIFSVTFGIFGDFARACWLNATTSKATRRRNLHRASFPGRGRQVIHGRDGDHVEAGGSRTPAALHQDRRVPRDAITGKALPAEALAAWSEPIDVEAIHRDIAARYPKTLGALRPAGMGIK